MLLRLSVKNFKSIRDAEVRFGPLTCFLGHNGAGKSNLFDAIRFLGALAEHDSAYAAAEVRRSGGRASPLDLIFRRDPNRAIELSADMLAPAEVEDDFGQPAEPSTTLLTYAVRLRYALDSGLLLVEHESLLPARIKDFRNFVGFGAKPAFRQSVALGGRRRGPFLSTNGESVRLHQDGGSRGRPSPIGASPRTVVGGTNTFHYPTVLAAKREMSSWKSLHLEPSAMRAPDDRGTPPHIVSSGAHLAATLHALLQGDSGAVRSEILFKLQQLDADIQELDVDSDEARGQLALRARIRGVDEWLYGRSLSEGALRYIALTLKLVDVRDRAVLCIEEPENGIHPSRVPALVELLQDYAVDPGKAVAADNPLRQVVLNTHSPEVARRLGYDDFVFVERALTGDDGPVSAFRPVRDTWRAEPGASLPVDRQRLADYLGGAPVSKGLRQLKLEIGSVT